MEQYTLLASTVMETYLDKSLILLVIEILNFLSDLLKGF